ncbi:MAG: creatininase family protein [Candidatus Micrarchaeota archaeon]|nr:creatininase family protein [Candidatus Micrarchaeota archaeon]
MASTLFGEHTSAEIAKIAKSRRKPVVIVPMGALEAHGEHMPLWSDTIVPFKLAQRVAERTGALVLPPITYGFCYTLRPWAGTVSLKSQTFAMIIRDITRELVRNGFDRILFMNGHGADATICGHVLKELADELKFTACIVSWWEIEGIGVGGHADEGEASLVMSLTGWQKRKSTQAPSHRYFGRVIPMPKDQFSKYGYAGKVGGESAARGRKMEKVIVGKMVELVKANLLLKE